MFISYDSPPPVCISSCNFEQPERISRNETDHIATTLVQITDVRLEESDGSLQVILETASGELVTPNIQISGNALIAEISNAVLALPTGETFQQFEPAEGIALIQVTELPGNRIQVSITGTDTTPTVEVQTGIIELILSVVPGTAQAPEPAQTIETDDPLRLLVTGESEEEYSPSSATVGTRIDTPLRDVPQSIQVIPQQVIEDQQPSRLVDIFQNAPSVVQGGPSPRTFTNEFKIRGFSASTDTLINGLLDPTSRGIAVGSNIDRVEILGGPASTLFGSGGLGGRVNLVTKQPLSEPYYSVDASVGSNRFYQGAIDFSGPLDDDETVLYRLNASAQTTESFIDFYEQQRYLIAPVLSWQISDRTQLTVEVDYSRIDSSFDQGIPAEGSVLPNPNGTISRSLYVGEPDIDYSQNRMLRIGYDFEHDLSDNWQLRSVFRTSFLDNDREIIFPLLGLSEDLRTLNRFYDQQDYDGRAYNLDNYFTGEFATGSIQHQIVAGVNLFRNDLDAIGFRRSIPPLDIFSPQYGSTPTGTQRTVYDVTNRVQQVGLYAQNLISLTDNFKILLGGRFDIASRDFQNTVSEADEFGQYEVFSPQIGIVYQPIPPISLYANYNRSFNVATSAFTAVAPEPERGEQFEIGTKVDFTEQLSATLAFYNLTRSNLPTVDPQNPTQTIQVGEQRSRGVEFNLGGEILPGWNVISGYAYTDAEITEDNSFQVGNRLDNVPEHAFNLWTIYEIQSGDFQGLGLGIGAFYTGERPGDLRNIFELPGYTRIDASLFYRQENLRTALNVRNLFDINYFVSAQDRNRVFPGEPLTVFGSVAWQF